MLRDYNRTKMSWAYKQGWLSWERHWWENHNPHKEGTHKYNQFDKGWQDAEFYSKVEGGYYDW